MAESILFDIAGSLLGKIASSAMQEIALAWDVESDLAKLNSNLSAIHAVLQDAEDKRAKNRQLDDWLVKLKDFMYDADDLIDEFQYECLRSRVLKSESTRRKVRNFFSHSNPLAFRHEMGSKMKALRESLDDISIEMSKFHYLTARAEYTHVLHQREMTHSFVRPSDVIGRENDKKRIIEHLSHISDGETVSIIPIVGIGGLGKTTLAKLVYNDDDVVQSHFEMKIWVCVSEEFEVTKLVKDIIKNATGENVGDYTMEQSQTCLRNTLRGKRFLLILDDVWNEDRRKWAELKDLLLDGAMGSKIIVTTRIPLVATIMGSVPSHNLEGLPHEDCLSLFVKWAFKERQEKQHPNLMEIGNEIVKKCVGVPLAVRTIGSLLYLKTDVRDWIAIRDSEIWKLEQDKDGILPILRLSYEQLPSHLKLCFSYCSLFPKDHEFNSVELVQFWMAQGLIRSSDEGRELEDIGNRYINELWSRSFFQDVSVNGFLIFFKMHDLVHDLALSIAKDEFSTIRSPTQSISKTIRYVAFWDCVYHAKKFQVSCSIKTDCEVFNFGVLIIRVSLVIHLLKRASQDLSTCGALDFGRANFEVLPRSIGDLKLLRLLDLSDNESIKKLPQSICKLQNLQTLKLNGCTELEKLPKDMGKYLINLRYFSFTTKQVSLEIGSLPTSLQFILISDCENLKSLGEGLERLTALRTLSIDNCGSLERLPRGLSCSTTIENLFLSGFSKIDTLELEGDAEDLRLRLRFLVIGELPKLEVLPQWIQGSVDSLEFLAIEDCSELSTLPAWLQYFTSLQKLVIEECPKLSALPEGMNHLTELEIEDCPELTSKCQPETGEEWTKIAHVPKITLDGEVIKSPEN